jgi:hypothetical protein
MLYKILSPMKILSVSVGPKGARAGGIPYQRRSMSGCSTTVIAASACARSGPAGGSRSIAVHVWLPRGVDVGGGRPVATLSFYLLVNLFGSSTPP